MHASKHSPLGHLHAGFVAMEYYALILNRSFLIFITDEGLRGWKFRGLVSSFRPTFLPWSVEPTFYKPFEQLLDDPAMVRPSRQHTSLMNEPGGFLIQYDGMASVEFEAKRKWGMGPILRKSIDIPHTGVLTIELAGGRRREFILLGTTPGNAVRDLIRARRG